MPNTREGRKEELKTETTDKNIRIQRFYESPLRFVENTNRIHIPLVRLMKIVPSQKAKTAD